MSKKPESKITQGMNEMHAQLVGQKAGTGAHGQNPYVSPEAYSKLQQMGFGQTAYAQSTPDYYQLSYLKRPDEGALWERHTEYFPTHDDSTTRALALSTGGAVCVRTLPRYWMG